MRPSPKLGSGTAPPEARQLQSVPVAARFPCGVIPSAWACGLSPTPVGLQPRSARAERLPVRPARRAGPR
ncbi:MAG: hypothetical protein WAS21_12115, partial [Geminicoccaceae bacterium]